ncbi:MAG: amino acid racemase [Deltaproteobacteria bacterium]|nr:amino acid racemase [Deltaproteobacteria bacterium]MBW1930445.1 amino acid racemase [Deltaproteobacteria bacterium]MBW2025375.1 amino acid racemase [Deltaproteobacteria bacterium]MBW2125118.1 amino acid racemase [Deltaproteobacteria bacterium]
MADKTIGILGGMGPEATLACFARIITNTPASRDQDHLRVVIDSNPKVPDRTQAILGQGDSPLPLLIEGCRALERAGADFVIIPCVTAHFFWEDLLRHSPLPLISLLDVVAEAITRNYPEIKRVGLLATSGTIQSGIFQQRLATEGIETLACNQEDQDRIMAAIYEVKKSPSGVSREALTANVVEIAQRLLDRGAQGIVAGCTEIPLILGSEHIPAPYFDSLLLLARAAIRRAGRDPKPLGKNRDNVSSD